MIYLHAFVFAGIICALGQIILDKFIENFSFFIIAFFTYFIALGDFTHIVVGSAEMFYAVLSDKASMYDYFFRFLLPTGLGNIIGGTGVFTLLIYAQINSELEVKE